MDARLVAKYFILLKEKTGFTNEIWAEKANGSVSTLKNLLSGKTEDPRLATIAPYIYVAGGSLDEMYTGKSKEVTKEITINSIKEIYEYQLAEAAKTSEIHINNIRTHYEQHRQDVKENYERRLADKREIIDQKDKHIKSLEKEILSSKIFSWICVAILVALLIAEVMNPNLGWFRF
jgi:molybdopterin converting factor small subunit